MQEPVIQWGAIALFGSILFGWVAIKLLMEWQERKRRRIARGFRSMRSVAHHQREREGGGAALRSIKAPHAVEWAVRQWQCLPSQETFDFAAAIGLVPCFTPVNSPESNGVAEAFVKTFKRDYAASIHCRMLRPCSGGSPGGSATTTRATLTRGSE